MAAADPIALAPPRLIPVRNAERSRDQKGKQFTWTDLKLVQEFGDDSPYKGHAVAYVDHPEDLAKLGRTMGHCAGTHFIWACEEKIWGFFTVVTLADMQPHITLHAKQLKWVGKNHPRDTAPNPYAGSQRMLACNKCRGRGGLRNDGRAGYWGDLGVMRCDECKGSGYTKPEEQPGDKIPYPKSSGGGYPSFADVVAAFESVGKKYEAGKWGPLQFDSRTYEIPKNHKERLQNYDGLYGHLTIVKKPDGVEDDTWSTYLKSVQEMKAQFDKGTGSVQIVGRTFKFDGKEWYVLSLSGRGDSYHLNNTSYRGMLHEFFVAGNKKKKEGNAK